MNSRQQKSFACLVGKPVIVVTALASARLIVGNKKRYECRVQKPVIFAMAIANVR